MSTNLQALSGLIINLGLLLFNLVIKRVNEIKYLPLFNIISGAIYSGVPHSVYVLFSTILANPKSVSLR